MDTRQTRYLFPSLRVCEKCLQFNTAANPLLRQPYMKIYSLGDKLVFEPTNEPTQFEVGVERNGANRRRLRSRLLAKHCGLVIGKAYKIYRMGTRYAVKLKEPLD